MCKTNCCILPALIKPYKIMCCTLPALIKPYKIMCCILPALILAIIGVALNILMLQLPGATGYVLITVEWGYKNVHISITSDEFNDIDKTATYQDSYDTRCGNVSVQPSYCKNLKDVINAGKIYVVFAYIGISLLAMAMILSCIIKIGKLSYNCQYRLKLAVGISILLATICFGVSAGVYLNNFSPNLSGLLNDIIYDIYPILSSIDWAGPSIGPSLIVIFCSMSISFVALGMLIVDCKRDNVSTDDQNAQNRLIVTNHSGVVPLTNAYGLSNENVVQANDGNNNDHVSEPDYVYTKPNMPQSNTAIYVPIPNDNNNVSRQV